jgi:hypothetical protein
LFDELPVRREECLGRPAGSRDALALIVPRGQWPPSIKQGFLQWLIPFTESKRDSLVLASGMMGLLASRSPHRFRALRCMQSRGLDLRKISGA